MDTETQEQNHQSANPSARLLPRWAWLVGGVLLVGIVGLLMLPVQDRAKPVGDGETATPVAVAKVVCADLAREIQYYAELRPYQEIDFFAKVSGYVSAMLVDFGDLVKEGQLLATIEVPELRDDLAHALAVKERGAADVQRAQAAYDEANEVYTHLAAAAKGRPNLIAQQDIDVKADEERNAAAALTSARDEVRVAEANVNKLRTMCSFTNIVAPFSGVITKRYADLGSLIQAGTASKIQAMPLVRLSQNNRLRLDFPVSGSDVSQIRAGDPVEIQLPALALTNTARIARFSRKVDVDTRTMMVEVDLPNPDLRLIPGMYASVLLRLDQRRQALAIPIQAVAHENDVTTVYVVGKDNQISERTVRLGLETPMLVEVLSGLKVGERIMVGSRAFIKPGQRVEPKPLETASPEGTS